MNNKKTRKKRSKIWLLPEEQFRNLVAASASHSEIMSFFAIKNHGGNYRTVQARIISLDIDTSHLAGKIQSSNLARKMTKEKLIKEVLIKDSIFNRFFLKKYLVKFDLLEYVCRQCKNKGLWMGETISLQLEHINGINDDNRLDNLCFLCPNCHSQTDTFAGKKRSN